MFWRDSDVFTVVRNSAYVLLALKKVRHKSESQHCAHIAVASIVHCLTMV